ncbi:sensor histidine kinase [Dethiothermospora halolimnae]|uniref:sensor histidine kinase n=1 Tax=Dethiothermospora halolimnae TaxID=3114390 RepID=UPI003CCC2AD5
MVFISLVIYLDNGFGVTIENIIYINMVASTFFLTYLIFGFLFNKRYYDDIEYIIDNNSENITTVLPKPRKYSQKLINRLIKKLYIDQNKKLSKLHDVRKENIEYITSWVHEVKTPISVMRLLIESNNNKTKEDILDSFEEELDRIDRYVEQALYHSRIDSFSRDYLINEINLENIIKNNIKKQAKTFISKKIKIETKNIDINISTDKKWLSFIIDQILSNSLKYTPEGGVIKIYGEKDDKEKRIIIKDNGIGIKEEDLPRVFQRGFTGYTGRQNNKSTGMGLYLAKRLSMKLSHNLTINSKYGDYTEVIIHFPKLTDYYMDY